MEVRCKDCTHSRKIRIVYFGMSFDLRCKLDIQPNSNKDGDCLSYNRKWWKFWAQKEKKLKPLHPSGITRGPFPLMSFEERQILKKFKKK